VAREAGLDASTRPITEADLVSLLSAEAVDPEGMRAGSLDGSGRS
jgi:hypothetical protein